VTPIQEKSVEGGSLQVVKRSGIGAVDLGGLASKGIRVHDGAEMVLGASEYLTLKGGAQRPHV
jgi:hypothetical protein